MMSQCWWLYHEMMGVNRRLASGNTRARFHMSHRGTKPLVMVTVMMGVDVVRVTDAHGVGLLRVVAGVRAGGAHRVLGADLVFHGLTRRGRGTVTYCYRVV